MAQAMSAGFHPDAENARRSGGNEFALQTLDFAAFLFSDSSWDW